MTAPSDLLTPPQAAELLGVNPRTVNRWVEDGRIPFVALPSGRKRIRRSDVDAITEKATA